MSGFKMGFEKMRTNNSIVPIAVIAITTSLGWKICRNVTNDIHTETNYGSRFDRHEKVIHNKQNQNKANPGEVWFN